MNRLPRAISGRWLVTISSFTCVQRLCLNSFSRLKLFCVAPPEWRTQLQRSFASDSSRLYEPRVLLLLFGLLPTQDLIDLAQDEDCPPMI